MKSNTLEYYDWDDVEAYICKELNIDQKYFRDYHKVIGGEYKDWWHVWISANYDNIRNGSYESVWFDSVREFCKEYEDTSYGEWILALVSILDKMEAEFGESIVVYYSW